MEKKKKKKKKKKKLEEKKSEKKNLIVEKTQNMSSIQLTEIREKEALRKRKAYHKCKNDDNHELEVTKLKRQYLQVEKKI